MKLASFLLLAFGIGTTSGAVAQPSISIGIQQPGVYGRIHIGDGPRPALIRAQPVMVAPPPVRVERQPVYLYVPPAEQQDWRRHCGRYDACGQPVYFVRETWVRERYEREHPGRGHGHGHGKHKDKQKHGNKHRDKH